MALLSLIPLPYRLLALAVLAAALLGTGWVYGASHEQSKADGDRIDGLRYVIRTERKQSDTTAAVEGKAAASAERVRIQYQIIDREVIRYVSQPDHTACQLDPEWVRLHDAAAGVPEISDPASVLDAGPSGLTTDDALGTIIDNYETCALIAERLIGLQAWVRGQSEVSNGQ